MKKRLFLLAALICAVFLTACGGGGSSSSSSGSFSLVITDAKPALPDGIDHVFVTIDEVSVHASGGDWVSLPLAQTPFAIDLLQFTNGNTTQLVPQTTLAPGHYTQVRLGVQSAKIVTDSAEEIPVQIPSGNLKTDKNFDFEVAGGGAVILTVDFDLSQSLVATGSGSYKLKPVLHLVQTAEAATITGSISDTTYGADNEATIIVTEDSDNSGGLTAGDVEYTKIVVPKGSSDPTSFSIYWLVPDRSYVVEVRIGGSIVYSELIAAPNLPAGAMYVLNSGNPI